MDLINLFNPGRLITLAILFLTSMPIHEWAHARAAYQLGDDTAALRGRLTINPYRLRGDRRASWALVSAAGPFSNLILAMLAAIPFRLGWLSLYASDASIISLRGILLNFILINLSLMLFNLIPIPPLDGSRVLAWLLPAKWASALEQVEHFGGAGLMLILYLLSRFGILAALIDPVMNFMVRALLVY